MLPRKLPASDYHYRLIFLQKGQELFQIAGIVLTVRVNRYHVQTASFLNVPEGRQDGPSLAKVFFVLQYDYSCP